MRGQPGVLNFFYGYQFATKRLFMRKMATSWCISHSNSEPNDNVKEFYYASVYGLSASLQLLLKILRGEMEVLDNSKVLILAHLKHFLGRIVQRTQKKQISVLSLFQWPNLICIVLNIQYVSIFRIQNIANAKIPYQKQNNKSHIIDNLPTNNFSSPMPLLN